MLLNTAAEELGHIEMLATAVAMNLENAPMELQQQVLNDPIGGSVLNGMNFRHILSTGLAALPVNADGVPLDLPHVYASGNIAGDMYANVTAEATGRTLAVRLYNMTNDPGMKDMLAYLIARDTMHQQQWLAVIEELGGPQTQMPVPNSFPMELENQQFSHVYLGFTRDGSAPPHGRWTSGPSLDGKGQFSMARVEPMGGEPVLGPAKPMSGAQNAQIKADPRQAAASPMQQQTQPAGQPDQ